ncbi:MAG: stage II sporulation protein D [Syntrophomonas sp.]
MPDNEVEEPRIKLYLHEEKRVVLIDLEEYITGTVAAEMPASFEVEALKAQAVAARSYTLRRLQMAHKYESDCDMSDDVNECQAYISRDAFEKQHGKTQNLWIKIAQVVEDTRGEIMIYDGFPIDALYHSTCGGRTESSLEAWHSNVPYLQSVACEYCRDSAHYEELKTFSNADLIKVLGESGPIKVVETTSSGRVKAMKINKRRISGEEFRALLGLPSNWLSIKTNQTGITVNSRGYGHGIGLCQNGSNGMAKTGAKYHDILKNYYQGIDFLKINY